VKSRAYNECPKNQENSNPDSKFYVPENVGIRWEVSIILSLPYKKTDKWIRKIWRETFSFIQSYEKPTSENLNAII